MKTCRKGSFTKLNCNELNRETRKNKFLACIKQIFRYNKSSPGYYR